MKHAQFVKRAAELFPGSEVVQPLRRTYEDCKTEFLRLLTEHYGKLPVSKRWKAAFEVLELCKAQEPEPEKLHLWDRLRADLQDMLSEVIRRKERAS